MSNSRILEHRLRKFIVFSALAVGVSAFGAVASERSDANAGVAISGSSHGGALLLAQSGEVDVYFDGDGNRVLVDRETGEAIAIQPPRRQMNRQAQRKMLRQRELQRSGRYYLDDPEDMARLRRDRAGQYEELPDDFEDQALREPPIDEFPEAPRDSFSGDGEPEIFAREPVQRQPLGEEPALDQEMATAVRRMGAPSILAPTSH